MRKILIISGLVAVAVLSVLGYWQYYYVYGEGTKAGTLNYLVKKGDVFKTYEGKLILEGIKSKTAGAINSEDFEFSVDNHELAALLMANSGRSFILHYNEYHRVVPWRGFTRYIVDSIVTMK